MCAKCAVEYELIEGKDANECKLRTSGNYCPAGHFKMPSGLCE
jgi:DNA-directed RNA polymerase subunit RPC12/RpoP